MPPRKRKASPPPPPPARDWALTSLKDEAVLADPLLLSPPLWWPHLYDEDHLLGGHPFTIPRALSILTTRKCELCDKGGIKHPPRSLGLKFGLFAHDMCVERILTDWRQIDKGDMAKYEAAGAPQYHKAMYSQKARREWTLTLVCFSHDLVAPELTVAGLSDNTLAAAKLAGERYHAGLAEKKAEICAALLPARAKRTKLYQDTIAAAAIIDVEKSEAEYKAAQRREVLEEERAKALAARIDQLNTLLSYQDSLPPSIPELCEKFGDEFIHRADCLGPFLKPIKTQPFPASKAIAHIHEALVTVAAERVAAQAATEAARVKEAGVAATLQERITLLNAALATAGPPLLPSLNDLMTRHPSVRSALSKYISCSESGEAAPYSVSDAVSLAHAAVCSELAASFNHPPRPCICQKQTSAKDCTKNMCGSCCPHYIGICKRHHCGE